MSVYAIKMFAWIEELRNSVSLCITPCPCMASKTAARKGSYAPQSLLSSSLSASKPPSTYMQNANRDKTGDMHAGVKYVEGLLPDSASLASLLDQQALLQFLLDKLPEAEATARRLLRIAAGIFGAREPAAAMCSLRLGAVLAGGEPAMPDLLSALMPVPGRAGVPELQHFEASLACKVVHPSGTVQSSCSLDVLIVRRGSYQGQHVVWASCGRAVAGRSCVISTRCRRF